MKWLQGQDVTEDGNFYYGASGTGAGWFYLLKRLRWGVGLHVVDQLAVRHLYTGDVETDGVAAVFRRDPATNVFTAIAHQPITLHQQDNATRHEATYALNLPVLADAGEYYIAWCAQRQADVASGHPGVRGVGSGATATTLGDLRQYTLTEAAFGPDFSTAFDGDAAVEVLRAASAMEVRYTSANGVETDLGPYTGTTAGYEVPRPHDARAFVLLRGVVVADGEGLTIDFRQGTSSNGTVHVDMGATDRIGVDGNYVNLPALNALGQAGDTFDIAVGLAPDDTGVCVLWVNRSKGMGGGDATGVYNYRDITTISHEAARSARNTPIEIGQPRVLHLSGNATIASVKVLDAAALFAVLSDSQCAVKGSGSPVAFHRLADELDTLIDGELWHAGIAGGRLSSDVVSGSTISTAGITRYDGTVGTHDLIDLVKLGGATLLPIFGVNDIAAHVSDAVTAVTYPRDTMLPHLEAILEETGHGRAVLFGLPPYSDANADEHESQAIRNWNRHVFEAAVTYDAGFVSPWLDMWDGTKNGANAYVFQGAKTTDGGLHYSTEGAADAAALLFDAIGGERSDAGNAPDLLDVVAYRVYRRDTPTSPDVLVAELPASILSYTVSGLAADSVGYYFVDAVSPCGVRSQDGVGSRLRRVALDGASQLIAPAPNAPFALTLERSAGGHLTAAWRHRDTNGEEPAGGFNLYVATGADAFNFGVVDHAVGKAVARQPLGSFADGTVVRCVVRARTSGGVEETNTIEATATALANPPSAPLTVTVGSA